MICKVCGEENPPTVGGICSDECVNKLKKDDKKHFQDELHNLFLKYANSPYTLGFNDIKEATSESIDDLRAVW